MSDWEHLEDLFTEACEMPESARADFVARHCQDDPALRDELIALLRAHDAASGFLDRLQLKTGGEADPPALVSGSRFGPWSVIRTLGRGGMGEVYEVARADGTFEQRAALKLLRHEAAAQIERFHAERDILARLDHPGIARLLDGGVADDGRPWAVLEYVEGETITSWCTTHNADLSKRLNLFEQVCEAVAYAHRNLIVHRDLKPSNILVDSSGRVRLLDFGIAKLIDPALGTSGETTQMPLTPDYCAPEQLAGGPVTTATDVYALGLLLYELLTGQKAWSIQGLPIARAIRTLIEATAPKPSVTAMTHADAPVPARLLRGDLDAIVARCLRKEPAHRYATVDALKQDIERHRQGRTVAARGGARMYVFGRFLRRYKWAVAGVAAIILALAAGIAATAWQAKRAAEQATRAEREARTSDTVKNFLIDLYKSAGPDKTLGQKLSMVDLLDANVKKVEGELGDQPRVQVDLYAAFGSIYNQLDRKKEAEDFSRRGLSIARDLFDENDEVVLTLQCNLAESLSASPELDANRAHEVSMLLDKIIASQRSQPEARQNLLVNALTQRAYIMSALGDWDAAESVSREAVSVAKTRGVTARDDLSKALFFLAGAMMHHEKTSEAIEIYREAISIHEGFVDPRDPLLQRMRRDLAYSLSRTGQYQEADSLIRDVIAKQREVLGNQHRDYVSSLGVLLHLDALQKKFEEADGVAGEYLSAIERMYGKSSEKMAAAYNKMTVLKYEEGNNAEASRYAALQVSVLEKLYKPDHPDLITARENKAVLEYRADNLDAAERDFENVARLRKPVNPVNLLFRGNIARLKGHAEEAERLYQEALALEERNESPTALVALRLRLSLAKARRNLGKLDSARGDAQFVLDTASKAGPGQLDEALLAEMLLAQLDYLDARCDRAIPALEKLQSLGETRTNLWDVAEVDLLLGLCKRKLGGKQGEPAAILIARARKAFAGMRVVDPFFVSLMRRDAQIDLTQFHRQ